MIILLILLQFIIMEHNY